MIVDLENIIRELTPGLLRYCTARTRDRNLAEEIAQESLVALIMRWNNHGAPESAQAFLFAIARWKAARAMLRRRLLLPLQILAGSRDHARIRRKQFCAETDALSCRGRLSSCLHVIEKLSSLSPSEALTPRKRPGCLALRNRR